MVKAMRESTLRTLDLGNVIDIFQRGALPIDAGELVDKVFGSAGDRGAVVISGANGIVGAGKAMQLGSRLEPYGVPIIALDFPGSPDGIGKQYAGLLRAFGQADAGKIMSKVIRFNYDGKNVPPELKAYKPKFLLEAIPEILDLKLAHFKMFKKAFPDIEIKSVTSGFPYSELGVGIAHPAFPHEINKIWEMVEPATSPITQLFWAMGMIPMPVTDNWSFVLDVLFCGLMLAGIRYCDASNMPFWKADKFIRKLLGPNPFRAHDAIGASGANFLTWSCLFHLSKHYGEVFTPTATLDEMKESGWNWYPMNHFRPLVDWSMTDTENDEFEAWILGALFQMTSLMLKEKRSHLAHMNAIGELCAQFRSGILAVIRSYGPDKAVNLVKQYHKLHPAAAKKAWYPEVFKKMDSHDWQQLYVNAEHDGNVGVISIARESYNHDVNDELNRAIDWLKSQNINNVIVTGDFHLSTQMIGADTSDFFPAMEDHEAGVQVAASWSATARRLHDEFRVSVGFINGKRCLGGFLELMTHCHYLVADENAALGMPEVTLPVVPGMEGCHWPFRKMAKNNWPKMLELLLTGRPLKAKETVGWLIDYAGPMTDAIRMVWKIAAGDDHKLKERTLVKGKLEGVPKNVRGLKDSGDPAMETARKAIVDCVQDSTAATLARAITVQAKHSGEFMATKTCQKGAIGSAYTKTMKI